MIRSEVKLTVVETKSIFFLLLGLNHEPSEFSSERFRALLK